MSRQVHTFTTVLLSFSFKDIIQNFDIRLDWLFKRSLLFDLTNVGIKQLQGRLNICTSFNSRRNKIHLRICLLNVYRACATFTIAL